MISQKWGRLFIASFVFFSGTLLSPMLFSEVYDARVISSSPVSDYFMQPGVFDSSQHAVRRCRFIRAHYEIIPHATHDHFVYVPSHHRCYYYNY